MNYLSTKQVAEMFSITERQAKKLMRQDELKSVKIGSQWYVEPEVLKDFLESRKEVKLDEFT